MALPKPETQDTGVWLPDPSLNNLDFGNVLGHEDSRKERESFVWNVLCFLHTQQERWQKF